MHALFKEQLLECAFLVGAGLAIAIPVIFATLQLAALFALSPFFDMVMKGTL